MMFLILPAKILRGKPFGFLPPHPRPLSNKVGEGRRGDETKRRGECSVQLSLACDADNNCKDSFLSWPLCGSRSPLQMENLSRLGGRGEVAAEKIFYVR